MSSKFDSQKPLEFLNSTQPDHCWMLSNIINNEQKSLKFIKKEGTHLSKKFGETN